MISVFSAALVSVKIYVGNVNFDGFHYQSRVFL